MWSATGAIKFAITNTKLYVLVVSLSTYIKLLKQLESGFKRIINWNRYQSKVTGQAKNRYLDFLNDPSFQGANRLFVSSFENKSDRELDIGFFFQK